MSTLAPRGPNGKNLKILLMTPPMGPVGWIFGVMSSPMSSFICMILANLGFCKVAIWPPFVFFGTRDRLIKWQITRKRWGIWHQNVLQMNRNSCIGYLGALTILAQGGPEPPKLGGQKSKMFRFHSKWFFWAFQTISNVFEKNFFLQPLTFDRKFSNKFQKCFFSKNASKIDFWVTSLNDTSINGNQHGSNFFPIRSKMAEWRPF